MKVATSRKI